MPSDRRKPPVHLGEIVGERSTAPAADPQLPVRRPDADAGEVQRSGARWLLEGVRYALPAAVVLAGIVVMALGSENDLEGGAGIVSAGLAIYFINWLFRQGVSGEDERDAEEAARDYFDKHGHWPGEGA
jgi:hypothetical protein